MARAVRTIVYLTNYVGPRAAEARGIDDISEAANRRIESVVRTLRRAGYAVRVVSAGWKRAGNRGRWHAAMAEPLDGETPVEYVPYVDLAFVNAVVCVAATVWRLVRLRAARGDWAVVYYNPTVQTGVPALLARLLLGRRIVLQLEDGTHRIRSIGRLRAGAYRLLLGVSRRLISGAIVPAEALAGFAPRVRSVVYRGDVAGAGGAARWRGADEVPLRFLFAGAWDEIRGVDLLLEALGLLEARGSLRGVEAEFVVCGGGPRATWVRERAAALRTARVHVAGFVPRGEYEAILRRSHVGLALQKHDHPFSVACFPSKVYEYLAAGKLVISSSVSDIGEWPEGVVLRYGHDDVRDIAALIEAACRDPARYQAVAERGRAWLHGQCDPGAMARAFRGLFEGGGASGA